jgi:hypothetical protein
MSCDVSYPNFQCRIWDASGPGGTPGVALSPVHTTSTAVALGWTYEDFTPDNVVISSGDLWAVYIEHNNSDMATDLTPPWSGRTMMYYMGSFYVDNGAYGNYMIRAALDTVFCAGVEPGAPVGAVTWAGPNPFRDCAVIGFALYGPSTASVAIYDVGGRLVRDLGSQRFEAGPHSLAWDGTDSAGRPVGAGVYFYRFKSGDVSKTGKLSLLR